MSGTAFGTIVLHVTPESAIGGPLAYVRSGDRIRLSVAKREISLLLSDDELARRAKETAAGEPTADPGCKKLLLPRVAEGVRREPQRVFAAAGGAGGSVACGPGAAKMSPTRRTGARSGNGTRAILMPARHIGAQSGSSATPRPCPTSAATAMRLSISSRCRTRMPWSRR